MQQYSVVVLVVVIAIHQLSNIHVVAGGGANSTAASVTDNEKILSRKRRYLIFPEGSSFQLVYCLTMPTYAIEGAIFTFGLTASLAWELPHDPYAVLRRHAEAIHRRKDEVTKLKLINEKKNVKKTNYLVTKKPLTYYVKPEWLQSKVEYYNNYSQKYSRVPDKYQIASVKMKKVDPVYDNRYNYYNYYDHIHRRTRRDLYLKLEKFLNAQRKDGKACILKALCEVSQISNKDKGTFVEMIIRTIFRWTVDSETENQDYMRYNEAVLSLKDCNKLYPTCDSSVFHIF